mgnify:CR=1 FL=1
MKRIIILFISIFVLLIVYVSTPSVSEEQMRTLFYEYIQRTFKEEYKKLWNNNATNKQINRP